MMVATPSMGLSWALFLLNLLVFTSTCHADVRFTAPTPGEELTAGLINVEWEESGVSPPISELTQYTLELMVGGNESGEWVALDAFESGGNYANGNTASASVQNGISAEVPNGFFFRMTSTREAGGVVINFSDRFSILGLNGDLALNIRQAAQELDGSLDGPAAIGNDGPSDQAPATAVEDGSTTTASLISSTTMASDPTPTETTSNPTSQPDDDSPDLSPGAIAGIASGLTILAIALLAVVGFFLFRAYKRHHAVTEIEPTNPYPQSAGTNGMSELSAEELLVRPKAVYMHATEMSTESMVSEIDGRERPAEVMHAAFIAELEGCSPVSPMDSKEKW